MDTKTKESRIDEIVAESASYDYKDFAADCVREVVSRWSDKEINAWFGEED